MSRVNKKRLKGKEKGGIGSTRFRSELKKLELTMKEKGCPLPLWTVKGLRGGKWVTMIRLKTSDLECEGVKR